MWGKGYTGDKEGSGVYTNLCAAGRLRYISEFVYLCVKNTRGRNLIVCLVCGRWCEVSVCRYVFNSPAIRPLGFSLLCYQHKGTVKGVRRKETQRKLRLR